MRLSPGLSVVAGGADLSRAPAFHHRRALAEAPGAVFVYRFLGFLSDPLEDFWESLEYFPPSKGGFLGVESGRWLFESVFRRVEDRRSAWAKHIKKLRNPK